MPFLRKKRWVISSSARIIHIKLHNLPTLVGPSCLGFKKEIERDKQKSASHVLKVSFFPTIALKNTYLLSSTFCNLLAVLRVGNVGLLFSVLRGTIFLSSSCFFLLSDLLWPCFHHWIIVKDTRFFIIFILSFPMPLESEKVSCKSKCLLLLIVTEILSTEIPHQCIQCSL